MLTRCARIASFARLARFARNTRCARCSPYFSRIRAHSSFRSASSVCLRSQARTCNIAPALRCHLSAPLMPRLPNFEILPKYDPHLSHAARYSHANEHASLSALKAPFVWDRKRVRRSFGPACCHSGASGGYLESGSRLKFCVKKTTFFFSLSTSFVAKRNYPHA